MTPRFLREEAARFRAMAEDSIREASKARLLAMADDYEARAASAAVETVTEPDNEEPAPIKPKAEGPATLRLRRNSQLR